MSTRPIALLVLAALVLAACGEDSEKGGGQTTRTEASGPVVATVDLTEVDFRIRPADPEVEEPGVVEFVVKNDGQTDHALEVEGPQGEAETKTIKPGQSATLKVDLDAPGSYTMYCPIGNHREMGMEGQVIVAGGGSAAPGTETEGTETDSTETGTTGTDTTGTGTETTETGGGSGDDSGGTQSPGGY